MGYQHRLREEAKSKKAKENLEKENKQKRDAYITRAIKYLQDRGKVIGLDFTVDNAGGVAENLAAEEAIAKMKAENSFIGFDGHNCEDWGESVCRGWDMESRRCDCGNRRVCWTWDGDFDNIHVYAEA